MLYPNMVFYKKIYRT